MTKYTTTEEYILKVLDEQQDGFIIPNQDAFNGIDTHELFQAIYSLIEKGVLRKRNCEGLAYEYNHKDLRSVIGAKEFKQRVKAKLMQSNRDIKEDDLYFSQTTSGYYMEYKPEYPNRSNADFIIYQNLVGTVSVHGNMNALVPTIQHYENIDDFEHDLSVGERCIKCNTLIDSQYFHAVSGKMCVDCIKDMGIYYALNSLGLIKEA